jgi:hypothetical protein
MVDIETVGLAYGAGIVEIAAAEFDPETGRIFRAWSADIDPLDPPRHGLTSDPDTLAFHAKKGTRFTGTSTLWRALNELDVFLHLHTEDDLEVWAWGADFEAMHLKANCAALSLPFPWPYYRTRDARTVWELAFPGVRHPTRPHRASLDVAAQVRDLTQALSHLLLT